MRLFEMEGFLAGKCLPGDMKVNETNAEYLVRKFNELESKIAESQREFRSADITMQNLEAKCEKLAAENAVLLAIMNEQAGCLSAALTEGFHEAVMGSGVDQLIDIYQRRLQPAIQCIPPTTATDAFLAEVRASGVDSAINTVIAMMNHQHPVTSMAINILRVHAYQVRKGVQS